MLIQWLFDKLGYMPKISFETEVTAWPFPVEKEVAKPQAKKRVAAKKPKVVAKTTRKKKA